jgi:ribulose-phosphate 3-epimerase
LEVKVAPSLLAADPIKLGDEVAKIENFVDLLHIDVMDGCFVPNLAFNPSTVAALRQQSELVFDVHLMMCNPSNYVEIFANSGADIITVHAEINENISEIADLIHHFGKKAGLAIKPKTPVGSIFPYLEKFDMFVIMSVEPGFGGQKYIGSVTQKVCDLHKKLDQLKICCDIEVDGGITVENARIPAAAGANVLVAGSAIFGSENYEKSILDIKNCAKVCQ